MSVEFIAPPSTSFPRYLSVSWRHRLVIVKLFLPDARKKVLAFTTSTPDEAYLYLSANGAAALWVRGTAYDMSSEEAMALRAALEPFGLTIETDSISAAPIGSSAVKESVCATAPPIGAHWESPAPTFLGAGAPELESMFAGSWESY